jgi:hypothetical protein
MHEGPLSAEMDYAAFFIETFPRGRAEGQPGLHERSRNTISVDAKQWRIAADPGREATAFLAARHVRASLSRRGAAALR